MKILPIHPRPLNDEVLSSWMTRLAIENKLAIHTLYHTILDYRGQIWNRDIDRSAKPDLIQRLVDATGQTKEAIQNLTLQSYNGTLVEKVHSDRYSRWILPIGVAHRIRRRFGQQFCPACLREGTTPYFRKRWRLSFITTCEQHRCLLHDMCIQCHSPIMFYRSSMSIQGYIRENKISKCCVCDFDIRLSPTYAIGYKNEGIEQIRRLVSSSCQFSNLQKILDVGHPLSLFNGLHCLAFLINKTKLDSIRQRIIYDFDLDFDQDRIDSKTNFEEKRVNQRHATLTLICCALTCWPDYFRILCRELALTKSLFVNKKMIMPHWLRRELEQGISEWKISK